MVLPPRKAAIVVAQKRKSKFRNDCTPATRNSKASQRAQGVRFDHLDRRQRSALMSSVRRTGTAPELAIRSLAHQLGFRFRVDRSDLPGRPDIVFPKYKSVIFVHGCFWHRHADCGRASIPAAHTEYWMEKFTRNVARDIRVQGELKALGWRVLVIWGCEIKDRQRLSSRLRSFLRIRDTSAG
ncbi:very short patch repair endonuclease [Tardiphaga sp. 803_E3_N1_3]|uniref:very short patch repair endonuclease n=1 Tax=Tardiphaga sp. 803_E3_N1_3 TaxID=3240785 RepID=UPI003F1E6407